MEKRFRIYSNKLKCHVQNEHGTHCFDSWTIDPFSGEVIDYVGSYSGEHTVYSKDEDPGWWLEGINIVKGKQYVIEQFSGSKDMKGKDIFERDVLRIGTREFGVDFEVILDKYGFRIKSLENDHIQDFVADITEKAEVIGHISEFDVDKEKVECYI